MRHKLLTKLFLDMLPLQHHSILDAIMMQTLWFLVASRSRLFEMSCKDLPHALLEIHETNYLYRKRDNAFHGSVDFAN